MTRLPSRLMYLSPILDRLEALPLDDLNEEKDMTDLDRALRQRLQGLDPATARSELDKDRQVLEEWLYKPGMEDSPGHFMLGWLVGSDPADWDPSERTKLDKDDIL